MYATGALVFASGDNLVEPSEARPPPEVGFWVTEFFMYKGDDLSDGGYFRTDKIKRFITGKIFFSRGE